MELLVNKLSLFPRNVYIELSGNPVGDLGMKTLSPHLKLFPHHIYFSSIILDLLYLTFHRNELIIHWFKISDRWYEEISV